MLVRSQKIKNNNNYSLPDIRHIQKTFKSNEKLEYNSLIYIQLAEIFYFLWQSFKL